MRPTVPDERPPSVTDPRLTDYLVRMFRACRNGINNLFEQAKFLLEESTYSAYVSIMFRGTYTGIPTLDGTWQTIDFLDTLSTDPPRHAEANLEHSSITVDSPGMYYLSILISFENRSDNAYRSTRVRVFDLTTSTPHGDGIAIPTGERSLLSYMSLAVPFQIDEGMEHDELVLQIGGGDTYQDVIFHIVIFSLHSIGVAP